MYSNALQESANSILYNGLIEELVDVLQITDKQLVVKTGVFFVCIFLWCHCTSVIKCLIIFSFLKISDFVPQDIKAASLRTLTSIVHLERTPKLSNIIDCTGTASYHGFLPVLVRNCIQAMIGEEFIT